VPDGVELLHNEASMGRVTSILLDSSVEMYDPDMYCLHSLMCNVLTPLHNFKAGLDLTQWPEMHSWLGHIVQPKQLQTKCMSSKECFNWQCFLHAYSQSTSCLLHSND